MTQLVLNDLINIDKFRSKYNKRVMARFNTDWSVGEQRRSYLDMYTNDPTLFRNWANSTYSAQHRTRESEQDLVLQFIKIQQPDLWLLTQAVNIQKRKAIHFVIQYLTMMTYGQLITQISRNCKSVLTYWSSNGRIFLEYGAMLIPIR